MGLETVLLGLVKTNLVFIVFFVMLVTTVAYLNYRLLKFAIDAEENKLLNILIVILVYIVIILGGLSILKNL